MTALWTPEQRVPRHRTTRGRPPRRTAGSGHIPEHTWRWIVYIKRKIRNFEREAQINKIGIG